MDKVEKFIEEELFHDKIGNLDIDGLISATHTKIKTRSIRRKMIYSSPIVILLLLLVITIFPGRGTVTPSAEGELYVAGWEYTWTETGESLFEDARNQELYEQSIDYLFDEPYYTYTNDAEMLLDENDLEALLVFLKEV
ncbi:MAG: hypothetical protein HQ508_01750 [Candidatus Marinimicrobia bacterium]|nr:hypothetical protein [Candidatus Neomarinimicrobiota bacterium]